MAAFEYEKIAFYNSTDSIRNTAFFKRANAFKSRGKHYEAYQNYTRINLDNFDDSSKCSIHYQAGLMLYLSGYYKDADTYLQRNFNLNINTLEYRHSILLNILVLNELNGYNEAKNKLSVYSKNYANKDQKDSIDYLVSNLYEKRSLPQLVSLTNARRLSKVLPGAGLFYIGKPGRAISNITFFLASLGYTGLNIYSGNYITSATAGVHMVRLFYIGGLNQLNELVPLVNSKRSLEFNEKVKNKIVCLF
jgi:tetratricopeptide (TPR) repeat protein